MLSDKYKPTRIADFIGNKQIIQPFIKWLVDWESTNKKQKCALVSGLNGIGKSLLIKLICYKFNYNIVNLSIDEERNKESMNQYIKPLLKTKKTFDGQENVLVVSDIDCSSDYGFMATLTECIKESEIPIICICDDRYSQNIKPILNYCFDIKLVKPSYDELYALVYKVVTNENIKIGLSNVKKLIEQSNGDIRFILNTLQLNPKKTDTSKNIQSSNIFDTTGKLMSREPTLDEKALLYWMANDIHTLMVQENYPSCTINTANIVEQLNNLSYSADALSDIDIIDCEPYNAYNTIRATTKCTKRGHIKFAQFLGKTATINKNKREKLDYETAKFIDAKHKKKSGKTESA